jgi:hypothetical protein
MRRAAALALLFAAPAGAEPLATLHSHNGSLPPPFHSSLTVTVELDGTLSLRTCQGYDTEGPACKVARGRAVEGGVEAIRAAVAAAGLAERPATEDPMPPIGGGVTSGSVVLDGRTIALPGFPVEADRARVGAVLAAIMAAVPSDLRASGTAPSNE